MTDRLPHNLRSDALDNRERILDAARALFAAEGLNVPMREIARRAGVGPATLYRRFPTKRTLVTEAFTGELRACHAIVDQGRADPDPWRGLCPVKASNDLEAGVTCADREGRRSQRGSRGKTCCP